MHVCRPSGLSSSSRPSSNPPRGPRPRRGAAALACGAACLAALLGGCAQQRDFMIVTSPRDAVVRINGLERGRGVVEATLGFSSPAQSYSVVASRVGFDDARATVMNITPEGELRLELKPRLKPLQINVEPADALVTLDGQALSPGRVTSLRYELPFAIDAAGREVTRTLRAERPGFQAVEVPIAFSEDRAQYVLRLTPLRKDLSIATAPAGAKLTLDGVEVGESPLTLKAQPFTYDARREAFVPRTLVATRVGYPPTTFEIGWDDGRPDYVVPLGVFNKRVRIETSPADAVVKVEGKPVAPEPDGSRTLSLAFPPVNDSGTLKDYPVQATLEREGEVWKPATGTLGWDDGQTNYTINLEEVLLRSVATRAVEYRAKEGRWAATLVDSNTAAWKDTTDGPLPAARRVTDLPGGASIGSFAVSPDGKRLVYALVEPDAKGQPKSRLYMSLVDGMAGSTSLTDGRGLDLTPTFNPAGDQILFSSDRGGGPMQVWSIPVDGLSGATRLTAGNADHLWPSLDTSPKARVFYQSLVPGQETPRLYSTQIGTVFETDLVRDGGFQPRLSPRNDVLAFVQQNPTTGKTDVCRTADRGGVVQKLTDTPDVSERDPAWSPDGTRLALTADVPYPNDEGKSQAEVYVVDANGGNLRAATMNDAVDDQPAWSPAGDALYFRSNRGGKWDIWRIDVR